MKYFLDTEFIENGSTIDLISLGIVREGGESLYLQNAECHFVQASDWVWRNVFPHLAHFDLRGQRNCRARTQHLSLGLTEVTTRCTDGGDCAWAMRSEIRDAVLAFCDPVKHGKPEFWGYFADYDWVAFCQLFGTMIELPKGFPMYCRDIKQLADQMGDVHIPKPATEIHHALRDAEWAREAYHFLTALPPR